MSGWRMFVNRFDKGRLSAVGGWVGMMVAAMVCGLATQAGAEVIVFNIPLEPEQEVPAPTLNGATPSGEATVTLDTTAMTVSVTGSYTGMTSNVNNAHIHAPAPVGDPAGVIVPLMHTGGTSGTISVTDADLSGDEVGFILNSLAYINVHTTMNGPGELRGQIPEPTSLAIMLGVATTSLLAGRRHRQRLAAA